MLEGIVPQSQSQSPIPHPITIQNMMMDKLVNNLFKVRPACDAEARAGHNWKGEAPLLRPLHGLHNLYGDLSTNSIFVKSDFPFLL